MFGKYLQGLGGTKQPGWDTWRVLLPDGEQEAYGYSVTDGSSTDTPDAHQLPHLASLVSEFVRAAPEPWFAWFAPTNPHVTTREFLNNPLPESVTRFGWLRWPFVLLEDTATKPSWIATRPPLTPSVLSRLRHGIRQQVREVRDLDAVVAGLYDDLESTGRLEDTVVVFASDGGVLYGEQRIGGSGLATTATKDQPYDACAKVPCIVRGPGFGPGEVRTHPAVLQDLTATILALAGATASVPQDGIDLRTPAAELDDRATLYERKGDEAFPDGVGIVTATRKLLRWADQRGDDRYEAYDLDTDPDELVSWANDPTRRAERDRYDARLDALLIGPERVASGGRPEPTTTIP
jgi:arylsulfatase A-like enzyme